MKYLKVINIEKNKQEQEGGKYFFTPLYVTLPLLLCTVTFEPGNLPQSNSSSSWSWDNQANLYESKRRDKWFLSVQILNLLPSYSRMASVISKHLSLLISCQFHFLVNEIVATLLFWVPQIPLLWKHVKIINRFVCFVDCACTMLSLTFHKISKSCASISWWQYKLASLCFLLFVFISSTSNLITLILLLQKVFCWKF